MRHPARPANPFPQHATSRPGHGARSLMALAAAALLWLPYLFRRAAKHHECGGISLLLHTFEVPS